MNVDFDIDMPSSFGEIYGPRVEKATRVIRRSLSLVRSPAERKMATQGIKNKYNNGRRRL
jgi:hypothetical protein